MCVANIIRSRSTQDQLGCLSILDKLSGNTWSPLRMEQVFPRHLFAYLYLGVYQFIEDRRWCKLSPSTVKCVEHEVKMALQHQLWLPKQRDLGVYGHVLRLLNVRPLMLLLSPYVDDPRVSPSTTRHMTQQPSGIATTTNILGSRQKMFDTGQPPPQAEGNWQIHAQSDELCQSSVSNEK